MCLSAIRSKNILKFKNKSIKKNLGSKMLIVVLLVIILVEFSFIVGGRKLDFFSTIQIGQQLTPTPYLNPAFNTDSLSMLTYWQKGVVSSAKTTTELKGTIIKIDTNGKVSEHGWPAFNYALKIRIQGENGDGNDIFISPNELQKTAFNKMMTDGIKIPISSEDLKINDKIQVFLTFDLTKDFRNNFDKAEIIQL
ncbi:MAG: hypothetical protein A2798_03390 [Candidatus Levybacteria bacterium RIFCSPHIGHO2_01_FULL_37_17]|nr:MAG: hypothetical protein A2798_03390 [Candidatus Levybacteria bacterium RIFCSPHIGHO2_01_FULL_37_17]OGH36897.1 MAG: hypothetical protein A2959_01380 [Candidatus Levybacteria bacterium RIFCSPLOWO2_01_FULL_38_23]